MHYAKGDYSRALKFLHKANRAKHGDKNILLGIVNCYVQLRDYDNAIRAIEQTLKVDSNNDKLYFQLGLGYLRTGNVEATIRACERAIEINPRELNYYLRLADLYERTNRHETARKTVCQGLMHFPDNGPLQILAAKSERRLDKYKESLKRLKNLSAQEGNLSPDWKVEYDFELGFVYVRSITQFLGLPWDEDVLNYRQNTFKRGLINTPSYGQVVKPIYKEARYRWHRYQKHFVPYFEKLKPHCDAFGYSLEVNDNTDRGDSQTLTSDC